METIYPFYVEGTNGREGYVELPYTLPQDSTLFVLLRHPKFQRIWQEKLNWIAGCGGMALLNVHPDYVAFGGKSHSSNYPADLYWEFLSWLKQEHAGKYWHVLPAEVARFIRSIAPMKERADQGFQSLADVGAGIAFSK